MEPESQPPANIKFPKKPKLSSAKSPDQKTIDPRDQILKKLEIYFKYRLASIYRQLKIPIYDTLLANDKNSKTAKPSSNTTIPRAKGNSVLPTASVENAIECLSKFINMNSKYHHRDKIRFSRTPLFKYIKYDFASLRDKINNEKYMKSVYEDLEDQAADPDADIDADMKIQYFKNAQFSKQSISLYLKKNKISGPVIVTYGYDDLRKKLMQKYGWSDNKDLESLCFHLKFMSKKKDIDYVNLLDSQIVNHFEENKSITAKFGLCRNINNLVYMGGDFNGYFPRCYDVNDVAQIQNYYEDFKRSEAIRILIDFVERNGKVWIDLDINSEIIEDNLRNTIAENYQKKAAVVQLAINILERLDLPIQEKLHLIIKNRRVFISLEEWEELKTYFPRRKSKNKKKQDTKFTAQELTAIIASTIDSLVNKTLLYNSQILLKALDKADPQFCLNSSQNIWIVKPASMSRGRGIKTFNDLTEILDYIAGKQISWVIQKYIERPLIIKRRKFDIRQWVILTDFKPLRVWLFEECYIRFCAEVYNPQNLKNRKAHLTNNSVTKGLTNIPENDGITENMMSQEQFSNYLGKESQQPQIFSQKIQPQIRKICIDTLKSVRQNMIPRKNTFQIYGYDFMIDQFYRVWLIEVNSSPTMEYSTKVTTRLVKKGLADMADLVVNYMMGGKVFKGNIGGWKLQCGH